MNTNTINIMDTLNISKVLEINGIDLNSLSGCPCNTCSYIINPIWESIDELQKRGYEPLEIVEKLENGHYMLELGDTLANNRYQGENVLVPSENCFWNNCITNNHNRLYGYYCDNCREFVLDITPSVELNGETYCPDCEGDAYVRCYNCGEVFEPDEVYYDECDGTYYCYDCQPSNSSNIRVYSYHEFRGYEPIGQTTDNNYFGFEIETDADDRWDSLNELEYLLEENFPDWDKYFHVEEDCSITGFEFISQPLAPNVALEVIPKFVDLLQQAGFYATSNCGGHVHITRSKKTKDNTGDALLFLHNNKDFIETYSRRTPQSFNRWCGWYNSENLEELAITQTSYAHAKVLNFEHRKTVECRLFRGTLNSNYILANMEFLQVLFSGYIHKDSTIENFKLFAKYGQFSYLNNYLSMFQI